MEHNHSRKDLLPLCPVCTTQDWMKAASKQLKQVAKSSDPQLLQVVLDNVIDTAKSYRDALDMATL